LLPNVDPDEVRNLLSRELAYNPDYYRIVAPDENDDDDLSQRLNLPRERKNTQPKLEFPVREHKNSNELLAPVSEALSDDSFSENEQKVEAVKSVPNNFEESKV
jgi:hypothetical protein